MIFNGGREQIRTAVEGFADLNLTTRSHGHLYYLTKPANR